MLFLDVLTLTVAGLLVGNEFAIAAFVHPALYRLLDQVHLAVAPPLARTLGRIMPFWYALTVLLVAADAWLRWHRSAPEVRLVVASAVLWTLSVVYTIVALLPINNRIASWAVAAAAPAGWKRDRLRWDRRHQGRVLLLAVAFVLLAIGIVSGQPPR